MRRRRGLGRDWVKADLVRKQIGNFTIQRPIATGSNPIFQMTNETEAAQLFPIFFFQNRV